MVTQQNQTTSYPVTETEEERLESLRDYNILDTSRDESFDNLTRLVANHFEVPIVLLSLMDDDRQWFKSAVGFDQQQTDRECAFCNYTIAEEGLFVVQDATQDERFVDNALVTGEPYIRFYAGYPLFGKDDLPIGTLCLIDKEVRSLGEPQRQDLKDYASQAETLLELHLKNRKLHNKNQELTQTQEELEKALDQKDSLLDEVHHRVKNNLQSIMSFLRLQSRSVEGGEAREALSESRRRIQSVTLIHERLHECQERTSIDFSSYCRDLLSCLFSSHEDPYKRIECESRIEIDEVDIRFALPLGLIITESVMNALDHAFPDRDEGKVTVTLERSASESILTVSDNGIGIPDSVRSGEESSFGMDMIRILGCDQLDGELNIHTDDGTTLILKFPWNS